jgi:hypothetical protein
MKKCFQSTYLPSLPCIGIVCVCVCFCVLVGAAGSLCWHEKISIPTQACISMMGSSANLGPGQAKKLGEIRVHYSPEANDLQRGLWGGREGERGSTMHNSTYTFWRVLVEMKEGSLSLSLETPDSRVPPTLSGLKLHQLSHLPKKEEKEH